MSEVAGRHALKFPVPLGTNGEMVTEVTLRRALAGDLRVMDVGKTEIDKSILLMARLTNLPVASIDAMDAADFTDISNLIGDQYAPPV